MIISKKVIAALCVLIAAPAVSNATIIQGQYLFNAKDNNDVSSVTQTVTALGPAGIQLSINFRISVATNSVSGNAVQTSVGSYGLSNTAGDNLNNGDLLSFSLSVDSFTLTDPTGKSSWTPDMSTLTFKYLNLQGANGANHSGQITLPTRSVAFTNIATAGQFDGQIASNQIFGGSATGSIYGGTQGFQASSTGIPTGNQVSLNSGQGANLIDANGGYTSAPITTFSYRATSPLANYRIGSVSFEIQANPEPSSMVLGGVVLMFCATPFARRRMKRLISSEDSATAA